MRRWLRQCMLVIACGAPWGAAAAQEAGHAVAGPYSTLTVAASGGRAASDGDVGRYWDSATAMRLDVHTRFHIGDVGGFVLTLPYRARTADQPDFRAYVIGLDWRFTPAPEWPVRPMVSVNAGNYLTTFDGVETKGLAKESEIFIGASAGLAARVRGGTHLTATITGIRVLTSTPIRSAFATIGLAHTMATPRWMRRVLE